MSALAFLPGSTLLSKVAGKKLDKVSEAAEALHNALGPIDVRDKATDYDAPHSRAAKVIQNFRDQVKRGQPLTVDLQSLTAIVDALKHTKELDDRKMFLEHSLVFLSRLPPGNMANKLQDEIIQLLFFDLPHPPATYMGPKHAWRTADGSGNNVNLPDIGKAGMPYSRSVQAAHPLVASELPDPELIYHALLKRDKFMEHPSGLSSLMFGFAALVIHSIFRTSFTDWSINETSSYIDLAPLYGNNQEMQDKIRKKEGYGLLHPDVIAEDRLLLLPPSSTAILILFNRNHNYIATKLLEINERGTYVDPATFTSQDAAKRLAQDDDIFNTARLVNCTWFANVVFSDYFAAILGLVRDGSSWRLNPFGQIRKQDHTFVERGQGNSVSVEFNLLYRWHATMSQADEQWTEAVFKKVFNNKPFDQITVADFGRTMREVQKEEDPDPAKWLFGGLTRDGEKFKDEDLARILQDATSRPACAFKARGSPEVMRIIEILGIQQARKWGICSLNDFRRFLQLKPYADFEDWNPNPEIAETARKLYGDIENLELYPGLQAEETKPVVPGAGLCPPYTISRAILADAIALCRGDRFYTQDFTPWNLTAWGFQDCQTDDANAGSGSMLARLFLRTLPDHYSYDSTYTWFPLMTPQSMEKYLKKLGTADRYTFNRPSVQQPPVVLDTFPAVWDVLKDHESFRTPYVEKAKELMKGGGYLLSMDDYATHKKDSELILRTLANEPGALDRSASFYFIKTRELIQERSIKLSGNQSRIIDIVDDVLNLVPIHFVSTMIAGFPLKTKENPRGTYRERELLQYLRDIFSYVFFEVDPAKRLEVRERAKLHTDELLDHIKNHLRHIKNGGGILSSISEFFNGTPKGPPVQFLQDLVNSNKDIDELANDVLSVVLIASVEFSQALVYVVNLYLEDRNAEHTAKISELARTPGVGTDAQLQGYVREALRLDPSLRGAFRVANKDTEVRGTKIAKDQQVYLSFVKSNIDPEVFSNPTKIDPSRPTEGYLSLNDAVYGALGDHYVEKTIAQVLRAVFSLKNIRRGPGKCGVLDRILDVEHGTTSYKYLSVQRELSPWARSMQLQYDE